MRWGGDLYIWSSLRIHISMHHMIYISGLSFHSAMGAGQGGALQKTAMYYVHVVSVKFSGVRIGLY